MDYRSGWGSRIQPKSTLTEEDKSSFFRTLNVSHASELISLKLCTRHRFSQRNESLTAFAIWDFIDTP